MGRRGPARTPTVLNELRGNPGKRPRNDREPQPGKGTRPPSAPRWLGEEARREWRRLARGLWEVGLLTAVDVDALAIYCETFALWRAEEALLRVEGTVIETTNGNMVQNPRLGNVNRAKLDLLRLMREFGLTPAARARVVVDAREAEMSLADVLFEGIR